MSGFALSRKAEEDLIQIYVDGAESFGLEQARRYHQKLFQAFRMLAEHPQAAPVRAELRASVRVHPVGSHLVIYTIRIDDVFILRIRHGREDWVSD